jgi:hypothetical protein
MTYKIDLLEKRAIEVLKEMGESAKLISEFELHNLKWIQLEITISSGSDILNLIHAGTNIGINSISIFSKDIIKE